MSTPPQWTEANQEVKDRIADIRTAFEAFKNAFLKQFPETDPNWQVTRVNIDKTPVGDEMWVTLGDPCHTFCDGQGNCWVVC